MSAHPAEQGTVRRARERARRGPGRDAQPAEVQGEGRRRRRDRRDGVRQVRRRRRADGRSARRQGAVDGPGRPDRSSATPTEDWDAVALVQYPSRKAFIEMVTTPEYEQAHEHRESGLERTVLHRVHARATGRRADLMGRKILFITTDQQRYDALGCNGGTIARTPVVDALAARRHQLPSARTTRTPCACRRARRCSPVSTCARTAWSPTACRCRTTRRAIAAYLHDAGRLPHRAARQGALRARLRLQARVGRELHGGARARPGRTAASSTPSSRCTCPRSASARCSTTASGSSTRTASRRRRASRRCSRPSPAATPARPRRASTRSRATGTTPTGSPIARSSTSTRCPTTTTGSCGCRSPIRTTRGIRPTSELHRCDWRDLDLPRRSSRLERGDRARARAEARALARAVGRRRGSTPKAARARTGRRT